jgi:hypothetical protein
MKHLLFALLALPLFACTAAPAETTSGGAGAGPSCSQAFEAQGSCFEIVHYLEGYGCTFSDTCNASCPSNQGICSESIDACKTVADRDLAGVSSENLASACQEAATYCASVFVCEPL